MRPTHLLETQARATPEPPAPVPPAPASGEPGVRCHYGDAALDVAGAAYDALASAAGAPVYARLEWLRIWVRSHPDWDPIAIEVRAGDGSPAAAVFLARRRHRGVTRVVLAGAGDCDMACIPAVDAAAAATLARAVASELAAIAGPWRAELEQVGPGSPVPRSLADVLRCAEVAAGDPVPYTQVGEDRDASAYLSRRFRKETRRRRRRMEEEHEVDVEVVSDPDAIAAAVADVAELRRRRDHDLSRPSTLDTAAGAAFWNGVVEHYGADGRLELAVLRADGRMAAFVISIVEDLGDGRVAYRGWDGRIATGLARFSPGQILDVAVFEHCLGRSDVVLVDYGRGDQQQKLHYANAVHETVTLRAWSSPWLRRYDVAVDAAVSRLRRFKESRPGLERRWRALKRAALRAGAG